MTNVRAWNKVYSESVIIIYEFSRSLLLHNLLGEVRPIYTTLISRGYLGTSEGKAQVRGNPTNGEGFVG